jgi:predicted cupin superfamily sugar epimerase
MVNEAKSIIGKLQLIPHPEGGYFKEAYRSNEIISQSSLPQCYKSDRNFSTSIYYLLEGNQVSLFHRLKSDEVWHHYRGSVVLLHCFEKNKYFQIKIGDQIEFNQLPQFVIRAGIWFAAEVVDKKSYSLIGCTVAPGFDFADFEIACKDELNKIFPGYSELIRRFTKD